MIFRVDDNRIQDDDEITSLPEMEEKDLLEYFLEWHTTDYDYFYASVLDVAHLQVDRSHPDHLSCIDIGTATTRNLYAKQSNDNSDIVFTSIGRMDRHFFMDDRDVDLIVRYFIEHKRHHPDYRWVEESEMYNHIQPG